jgi:hypothetical protein
LVILRKLRDIRTLLCGATLWMVFSRETTHCSYAKAKASLGDRKNYLVLSSLLKDHLGGSI